MTRLDDLTTPHCPTCATPLSRATDADYYCPNNNCPEDTFDRLPFDSRSP